MDIKVPFLGEGATSGTVVNVAVKEGDRIEKDQMVIELENEKAVAPVPATAAGKVTKIHVKEGDQLSVGALILSLEAGEEKAEESKQGREGEREEKAEKEGEARGEEKGEAEAEKRREGQPLEKARPAAEREAIPGVPLPASPTIRKLARDLGIDLARIRGSEPGGRIVMADLRDYIRRLQEVAARKDAPKPAPEERIDFSKWGPVSTKPLTRCARRSAAG
jgi:pyruvate dehydrogenase E2 component (dihydrolipoamide acetyltransferase)